MGASVLARRCLALLVRGGQRGQDGSRLHCSHPTLQTLGMSKDVSRARTRLSVLCYGGQTCLEREHDCPP